MVSSDLFFKSNARLLEIFMCSTTIEFAGYTSIVIFVADLLQLSLVIGESLYATVDSRDSLERHMSLNLRCTFQLAELTIMLLGKEVTQNVLIF